MGDVADHVRSSACLVLLGPPGCGKGTQAARLSVRLDVPAISTGEMLRAAVAEGSELGERVGGILDSGVLVDDDTMAAVVRDRLKRDDARHGFLLDGYPRTLPQAATLSSVLEGREQKLKAVLLLEVPEDVLLSRALARRRADDTEEVIRHRLQIYEEQTSPLVGYYSEQDLLRRINGDQSMDAVTTSLLEALEV